MQCGRSELHPAGPTGSSCGGHRALADGLKGGGPGPIGGSPTQNDSSPPLLQVTRETPVGRSGFVPSSHQLISSCRLFGDGGHFAPQEVTLFQRRLRDETKRIRVTEESVYTELEAFESTSLQQVFDV